MKFAFISLFSELSGISLRLLSAEVRAQGCESRIVFVHTKPLQDDLSPETCRLVGEAVAGYDVVGLSVMTPQFFMACQASEAIRENTQAKIIWGGMHATTRPEESLEHADWVCVGEGESVLRGLIAGRAPEDIQGLWYKKEGEVVANGHAPMEPDLTVQPFQDFSFDNHILVSPYREIAEPLTRKNYAERSAKYEDRDGVMRCYYKTMTTRGCPLACTYCNNSVLHDLYTVKHFRKRSMTRVIEELEEVIRNTPEIELIHITDDTFLTRKTSEILEFAALYKERIGLPFRAITLPNSLSEAKLDALVDAGLCHLYMGIESGSEQGLARYQRSIKQEALRKSILLLNRYQDRMLPPKYDVICHDPLATLEENRDTVRFLATLPQPRIFVYFNLVLFPGTKIAEEAAAKGLIKDEIKEVYRSDYYFHPRDYYDVLLLALNTRSIPPRLIGLLAPLFLYRLTQWIPPLYRGALGLVNLVIYFEAGRHRVDGRFGNFFWYWDQLRDVIRNRDVKRIAQRLKRMILPG